MYLYNFSK